MTTADVRDRLTRALRLDLIGPEPDQPQVDEILDHTPTPSAIDVAAAISSAGCFASVWIAYRTSRMRFSTRLTRRVSRLLLEAMQRGVERAVLG